MEDIKASITPYTTKDEYRKGAGLFIASGERGK
jgi:hypothetical protein